MDKSRKNSPPRSKKAMKKKAPSGEKPTSPSTGSGSITNSGNKTNGGHKNGLHKNGERPKYKDQYQENRLPAVANFVIAVIVLAAHIWFLFFLEGEYTKIPDKTGSAVRDYIELWIPVFLVSIAFEVAWAKYKRSDLYHLGDSLCCMGTGMIMQVTKKIVGRLVGFYPYLYIWRHFAVTDYFATGSVLSWWLMFLGVEFGYYWVHRTGHTMGAFWAMHGIHHSSEEYNLSVSLRQSMIHNWFNWAYYLPLAFFFPPTLMVIHSQYNTLYQFWIHTQTVSKLGPLEYVLNTPSQHRVHHGKNPYCIDKNYGGTLCIFDRLFGTFQEEIDGVPIVYGTVHPINTFNSVEANLHPWRGIWESMKTVGFIDKFLILYNGPGWIPGSHPYQEYAIPPCTTDTTRKYTPKITVSTGFYIFIHFFVTLALETFGIAVMEKHAVAVYCYAAFTFWSLACTGGIADRRWWAYPCEVLRLLFAIPMCVLSVQPGLLNGSATVVDVLKDQYCLAVFGIVAVSLLWITLLRSTLTQPMQPMELGETNYEKAAIQQEEQYRWVHYVPPPLPPHVKQD